MDLPEELIFACFPLGKQGIHNLGRIPEISGFEASESCRQIDDSATRRELKDSESAGHCQAAPLSDYNTIAIIHQNKVGPDYLRERDRRTFAVV